MAVIRCQSCGKPNPDFLEVCQFCEARLKPLTANLAESAEPTEASGESAGVIRCQSCGKPNPDYLEVCQFCEARLKPLTAPLTETSPQTATLDSERPGVIRCQSCGRPNPDFLEVCQFCEARLKPLTAALAETPLPESTPAPEAEVDPLARLRAGVSAEEPETFRPEPGQQEPEWLWTGVAAESAEVEPVTPAEEVPDWLSSLRTSSAQPESRSADRAGETPAEETPDWMSSFRAATAESRLARQAGEPAQPESLREAETAPEEDIPDWLKAMRTETEPTEPASAEPDWLSSFRTPSAESAQPAESAAAPAEEIPDWLKSMQQSMDTDTAQAQPTTPAFAPGTAEFDFFDIPETPTPSVKSEMPPAEELPEWLSSLSTGELAPSEVEPAPSDTRPFTAPFTEQPTEVPPAAAPIPGAGPDWLAAMRPGDLDSALAGISTEAEPLTRRPTPSLISEPVEGLAPSALPSWLEAMRPVDVQRPQIAPETDTYEETVGVLAGMRGVLQAEPTIAMPRRSTMQVHQVNVSDAHSAQAALLTNLLNEDTQARPAVKRRVQLALPLERWMVFAILAVGLLIPSFLPGLFSLPSTISRETQAAYNLIEGLPPDKPALVAFDYDAAQTGELNPAAEALISHLLRRGVPIVGVSTRLTGAAVGQDLLQQLTADLNATYGISYTYGTHFINLGYIPGGPVGLLQFAAQPRSLFTSDFSGSLTVLETSLMSPVGGLNDFGLVVLITATPDSARAWVEQTQNYAANVPMVAAVSAGADPLVRPYYEADPPQIRGLVSGILQTTQYERQAGVSGAASARWERLGIGLLTAAALLAVGNLIYGVMGVLSRRAK